MKSGAINFRLNWYTKSIAIIERSHIYIYIYVEFLASHFNLSKFTGWAIKEELSIRRRPRTFLVSWGQNRHDMGSGLKQYVLIWTSFWIFLSQSNNLETVSVVSMGQHGESFLYWNTTTGNNSSADVFLLRQNVKIKCKGYDYPTELSQITEPRGGRMSFLLIAQSLTS